MILSFKRLLFFWSGSTLSAVIGYYVLWLITPNHSVFGTFYRMFLYHYAHPISYIVIPCFFYGIFATAFSKRFKRCNTRKRMLIIFIIILLTVLFSSFIGGMLWHYHDMQAGFFPQNWIKKCMNEGAEMGLGIGWLIILLSFPYNILGTIVCYHLTKKGVELFQEHPKT